MSTVQILGTCSLCSGPVSIRINTHGLIPAQPECQVCRAVPICAYGPIIPTRPARPWKDKRQGERPTQHSVSCSST